jgi:hypothetical protein
MVRRVGMQQWRMHSQAGSSNTASRSNRNDGAVGVKGDGGGYSTHR